MTWLANGVNSVGGRRMVAMAYWPFFASWGFSISDKSEMETLSSPQVVSFPLPGCFVLKAWVDSHLADDMKSCTSKYRIISNRISPHCLGHPFTSLHLPEIPTLTAAILADRRQVREDLFRDTLRGFRALGGLELPRWMFYQQAKAMGQQCMNTEDVLICVLLLMDRILH